VQGDLAAAASSLHSAEIQGQWWSFMRVEMGAWPEYRDVLASKLTQAECETVSQAVIGLGRMEKELLASPVHPGGRPRSVPLTPVGSKQFKRIREDAGKAYTRSSSPPPTAAD